VAVADEFPGDLIGFLKPEMKIAVDASTKPEGGIDIIVLTDERFALELDAKRLPFAELVDKYPAVSEAASQLRDANAGNKQLPQLRFQPHWISQYTPMIVIHSGMNYVLLRSAENKEVQLAIRADRIDSIRWGVNSLPIGNSPSRTTD
jgi:hypothetical protein